MGVTVTYADPVTGVTPPTAAVMQNHNSVTATVIATLDGDTDAVITHNMNLSTPELAELRPWIILVPLSGPARLSLWVLDLVASDDNTITLHKATTGGSGDAAEQLLVTIQRPHSMIT